MNGMVDLEPVEVAVAGAGPAGCLMAARLAAAGRRVTVFEAGPPWRLQDLVSSQIWARRLKWGGAPVLGGGADPPGHNFATGWGLGGAALHHYAGWPRLRPEDFKVRSLYGRAMDWPLTYEDLRAHYDRIQGEVGLSGDLAAEHWRTDDEPYPMPPVSTFRQAQVLARGFAALGKRIAPTAVAINSVPFSGRAACVYDGWCDAGCPIGALANPLVTYYPRALAAGVRFLTRHTVNRVRTDAAGRATGLELYDEAGARCFQPAAVVVLAASAVQNPRLLLRSTGAAHPRGLGNSHGLVGRFFFNHSVVNVYGLFDRNLDNHLGLTVPAISCMDGYEKRRANGPFGSHTWGIAPALKPNDLLGIATTRADVMGAALHEFMLRAVRGLGSIVGICETLAERDNRVELAAERDRFGEPLARIVNHTPAEALALWAYARDEGVSLLRAAGAGEVWHGPRLGAHQLGGTVMGTDPCASVADAYGRLHDAPNVVLAGSGLFPTCGAASPTFTIHALADRIAARMATHWGEFAA